MILRPYQETAVAQIRAAFVLGARSVCFQLPTGGGKTYVFSYITAGAVTKGTRTCICVHRRELLRQCSRALTETGVAHGVISPGEPSTDELVQVASIQTLVRRHELLDFDFLVFDEGHHAAATTFTVTCNECDCSVLDIPKLQTARFSTHSRAVAAALRADWSVELERDHGWFADSGKTICPTCLAQRRKRPHEKLDFDATHLPKV